MSDVTDEAISLQRQYDAVGDEPQDLPEGVNLYWGNDPERNDRYELWKGEQIDEAIRNHRQPFRMLVDGSPNLWQTIRWFSRYGTVPFFTVTIRGFAIRSYRGVAKVDGTRTMMLWDSKLGGDGPAMKARGLYVVNRWPKELLSVRFSTKNPKEAQRWDNMGGI